MKIKAYPNRKFNPFFVWDVYEIATHFAVDIFMDKDGQYMILTLNESDEDMIIKFLEMKLFDYEIVQLEENFLNTWTN